MPSVDRTQELKDILKEKGPISPDPKLRKSRHAPQGSPDNAVSKEYVKEGYVILGHINTLLRMLANVRKPYLNMDTRAMSLGRSSPRILDLSGSEPDQLLSGVRYLTNEERDQIDLQARVILTRCADRVKEMEALERRRVELVASRVNPLTKLLPSRLRQTAETVSSDFIAAHHASITWYLNRMLTMAGQIQKELQEERIKRQSERTRTLGSGAAKEASSLSMGELAFVGGPRSDVSSSFKEGGSWLGNASSSLIAATIGAPSPTGDPRSNPTVRLSTPLPPEEDDEDDEIELSASQIMQFETENANILRNVQDTLESVQQAESRLVDISALQMELVTHLTRQTELTDQLYEDAIATTVMVDKGNEQLREARRRAKDSRLFILMFLVGASLSLLFLHYY
ncbi:hypothetical protein PLEOSDRAFT_26415 [Pleurotus ostreatus PC15]|uniref:t-SNARE coiled-coil homology domain-containing protein n=1 Tax=Pleurotus ostreatus (strain PC15) TaxID=1137138 RepID=A0A067NYL6_PLEO1|nr:hypothetical protein PLEOSDRAFT_26415 [Pleurotus ostreatus PC15]